MGQRGERLEPVRSICPIAVVAISAAARADPLAIREAGPYARSTPKS